jgi:hypothetical protein
MSTLKKITLGDGRTVAVDEFRFATLDAWFRHNLDIFANPTMTAKDAQEALAFTVGELTYLEQQAFEKQYEPMQFRALVPVTNKAGEAATTVAYRVRDGVGMGKRFNGSANDIPRVDVGYAQQTFPVYPGAIGYGYSFQELRQSAYLRRPLDSDRMAQAIEGCERHLNYVALQGETASNLTGLFNNANVSRVKATQTNWPATATTAESILNEINNQINTVWTATRTNDIPDTLVLPPAAYTRMLSPRATGSDMSILKWVTENNIAAANGIKFSIVPCQAAKNLGNTGATGAPNSTATGRAMLYKRSENRLVMHVPMPLRFAAPQISGLEVFVPAEYSYSGVEVSHPKSALYIDDVAPAP